MLLWTGHPAPTHKLLPAGTPVQPRKLILKALMGPTQFNDCNNKNFLAYFNSMIF